MDESTNTLTIDWLTPPTDGTGCDHVWDVEVEIPKEDLPTYVQGSANEIYCSACGVKQTLKDRIALAMKEPVAVMVQVVPEPPRTAISRVDPDPVPLADIKVELNLAHYGKRYDNNRRRGIVDRAINIEGDMRLNDALAAAAEEYAAKALGLYYEGDTRGPDRGYDLLMGPRRIQVKWTKGHSNRLIASPKQTNLADYYVLVTGSEPAEFLMPGWATLAELKAQPMQNLGYGPTYCLNQYQLHPFSELLEMRSELLHR